MTQHKDAALAATNLALTAVLQAITALNDAVLTLQDALKEIQAIAEQAPTPTPTASASATPTPTASTSVTPTPSPTATASATPAVSTTPTPSTSKSPTPTASTSVTPTPSTSLSATPKPSPTPAQNGRVIPVRKRGAKVIDAVKAYNIDTTGKTDVTAKFQTAINALPLDGGTVYVSAGSYLIDAEVSIKLRSNMLFDMHPDAKFYAKSNSNTKYSIIFVENKRDVEIRGGQLFGDRETHNYVKIYMADGVTLSRKSTHEWGHGIRISGSVGVTVNGTKASNFTGDGTSIGPFKSSSLLVSRDIFFINFVGDNNRRQGMSIGNVWGIKVFDSKFINTNGTSPQCGIDIEPNNDQVEKDGVIVKPGTEAGTCKDVWIEGCLFENNAVYGLNVFLRISDVTVIDNDFVNNVSCGAVTVQAAGIKFIKNRITGNGSTGMFIKKENTACEVTDNEFKLNYAKQSPKLRATPIVKEGIVQFTVRDLLVASGADVTVNTNKYF